MSNFKDSPNYEVYDDYYTPLCILEKLEEFVPKDWRVFEPCLLGSNEQSKKHLESLGYGVLGSKDFNFLTDDSPELDDYEIIITNPPFQTEIKKEILKKIVATGKPFILIMNTLNIFSKYFHEIFKDTQIEFIVPDNKFHYDKYKGEEFIESKKKTSFYSIFITHKVVASNKFL